MERTEHLLLVGEGARAFAKRHGFEEENLLTEAAKVAWASWKERGSPRANRQVPAPKQEPEGGGTINVLVLDRNGDIAGVTSTTGHRFKLVGRVGDSAIIGAGLYVDNAVGGAGATGHGEEAIKVSASFLAVEKMREGNSPQAACEYVCQRIVDRHQGHPLMNVKMVALNKAGHYGCCSVRGGFSDKGESVALEFCIRDERGHRVELGRALLPARSLEEEGVLPLR
jgi:N4-(beta-N-acetylglucosaminyl)-L-asparaginase